MFQLEVQRDIDASIEDVFARLIDITGYSNWLPEESFSRGCELTSDGPVDVGTTYVDHLKGRPMAGEVLELERPNRVVFRQWTSWFGRVIVEVLQTNVLEAIEGRTRVHHRWEGQFFGAGRLLKSYVVHTVRKERPLVFDALKASFES